MDSQLVAAFVLLLINFAQCSPKWLVLDSGLEEESLISDLAFDGQPDDVSILQFSSFGEKRSMILTPANDVFADSFKIKQSSNTTIVDSTQKRLRGHFYTEKDGFGSLYVENVNGELRVDGVVDKQVRIRHINGAQKAFRVPTDYSIDAFIDDVVPVHIRKQYETATDPPIVSVELPEAVTVEVYSIIDNDLKQGLDAAGMCVEKYLGILWNLVNNEYKTTSAPRMSFAVTGTFLLPESDWIKSTYVTTEISNPKVQAVDSHTLLDKFGDWLFEEAEKGNTPHYDVSILHTGLDLASFDNRINAFNSANLGVAYGGGVCIFNNGARRSWSAGLMEDLKPSKFVLDGIVTVAHEVAHLFGANHDDQEPAEMHCPKNYIMFSGVGYDTIEKFSECSLHDMRAHLSLERSSCILDEVTGTTLPLRNTDKPKAVTPDEVCTERYGKKTKAVPTVYLPKGSNICERLFCFTSPTGGSWNGEKTPDGMICDDDKSCVKGNCQ